MTDSPQRSSFLQDWLPTGLSGDVTLSFQKYMEGVAMPYDALYYFKPISTFDVPGLTEIDKFEDIDAYIAEEFCCDPDDIHTIASQVFGSVIVMPEGALKVAGVPLPRWPEKRPASLRTRSARPIIRFVPT